VYRRQQLTAHLRLRLPLTVLAVAIYVVVGSPWALIQRLDTTAFGPAIPLSVIGPVLNPVEASSTAAPAVPGPAEVAHGSAYIGGIGDAALTNIEIAISFVDGAVIEPGEQLSFDDTAHTWDFNEDPIYEMGTATTTRGIIFMRGGGVCWVSTALWRAALAAGLRTDFRENHFGLVDQLGPGIDATNTLVIRNDASVPIIVSASLDDDERVQVSLLSDEPLDRTADVNGPWPVGGGTYAIHQDVTWADGRVTSSEFRSHYYW